MVAEFFGLIAKGQIDEAYANLTKGIEDDREA
jgi:hypothetical protein